jgi:hypothetical protein
MAVKNIQTITALSSGTLNVNVSKLPTSLIDTASVVRVIGTVTLSGNLNISPTGTPSKNAAIKILWEASVTLSGNSVVIFGETVPDELAATNFVAECVYDGAAWVVNILPDFAGTGIIAGKLLAADSVSTAKILDDAVTNAKLANITRGSVKVGGASDAPTDLDAKTSGNILVGDGTDIASVAVSGDATLSSAGALTIANSAVTTAKIDAAAVTAAKLDSNSNKAQITIPISFEDASELGVLEFKMCFDCTVDAIHGTVTKPFVSTGTHIFKDDTGTVLTGSQIDMSSALTLGNIVSTTPTANNSFSAGDVIKIETSTSGAVGGKSVIVLCCTKV